MSARPGAIRHLAVAAVAACLWTAPAAADIVVLETGDFLKVESYTVGETSVVVRLALGGTMTLPLTKVVQILDDELVVDTLEAGFDLSALEVGFRDGQAVPSTEFGELIFEVGQKYGLNPKLLAAIVAAESNFEPWARSNKGAVGLMQVMPATAERFGVDPGELYDPFVSLDVGTRFLAHLRGRYDGDLALMLAAYNSGEATVERFGGVPPYLETQTYIRNVERFYQAGPS